MTWLLAAAVLLLAGHWARRRWRQHLRRRVLMKPWSEWVALGLDERLFWRLTVEEIKAVFSAWQELEYQRMRHISLSASIPASVLANRWRRRGAMRVKPKDFVGTPTSRLPKLTGDVLKRFAEQHNARVQ